MGELRANPLVEVEGGELSGTYEENGQVKVFKGIPYAQPPVGDLRWKPPQPVVPWQGIKDADASGSRGMQLGAGFKTFMKVLVEGQGMGMLKTALVKLLFSFVPRAKESEDCLTLTIRAPIVAKGESVPVMIWFHGGDHQDGSGSDAFYASNALAQRGVVFVSINYRLGLMGYFAHPELSEESEHGVSGNYGTLDQIAALRWVQGNIGVFGGDPDNVTIFGQSAGGESVAHMLTSPLAKGLFHRAIMQSPGNSGQMLHLRRPFLNHRAAEETGKLFADRFVPPGEKQVQRLRQMAAPELYRILREEPHQYRFYPNIDGYVLEKSPFEAFLDGEQARVPLLIGSNADEGTLLYPVGGVPLMGLEEMELPAAEIAGVVSKEFGDDGRKLLDLYPGLKEGTTAAAAALLGDSIFGMPTRFYALQASRRKQPVYFYFFTRTPPSPRQTAGAFHAAEVSFVHGSRFPLFPVTEEDDRLARVIGDYWVQFAKSGDPNVAPHPEWPTFNVDEQKWMRLGIGDQLGGTDVDRKARYDILQKRLLRHIKEMKELSPSAAVVEA